jgi:hypothetical protein
METTGNIAMFGEAQILKHLDGRLEIRGGTDAEQAKAHPWMKQSLTPHPRFGPWSHYRT